MSREGTHYTIHDIYSKEVLFYYVLGYDLSKYDEKILQFLSTENKLNEEIQKLKTSITKNKKKYGDENEMIQKMYDDFLEENANCQESKIAIKDLSYAVSKIDNLLESIHYHVNDNEAKIMTDFLIAEKSAIESNIQLLRDKYSDQDPIRNESLEIMYEIKKHKDNIADKERKEKELVNLEKDVSSYHEDQEKVKRQSIIKSYEKTVLDLCNDLYVLGGNNQLSYKSMKVSLKKGDKKGEGNLRILRSIYLIAIQFHKLNNSDSRGLGVGLYDSIFSGADLPNIISLLEKVIKYMNDEDKKPQLFLFITKPNSSDFKDELDRFMENEDLIYSYAGKERLLELKEH